MKTLIIGPSVHRLGGITTVISFYKESDLWKNWGCIWIGTSLSRSAPLKLIWLLGAIFRYGLHLPFADIVHIHVANGASVLRKKMFFYPAYWFRKKVVLHLHAPSFGDSEVQARFEELRHMFERANVVVALSGSWAALIKQYIPRANVAVVANAVSRPEQVVDIAQRRNVIFYAGKLEFRKGYNHLIEAFALICNSLKGWEVELAGDGEIDKAIQLAAQLGIQDRVRILGWVPRNQMLERLGSCKIFCLPSHAEGFPMSVLESLAYGCATVTTPVGGLQDDLQGDSDVVFSPPGNSDALAEALMRVALSDELQRKLSCRGRWLSQERYSRNASLIAMESVYKSLSCRDTNA